MFWGFLLATGLAFVFVQLGAMSVWVSVLRLGLMVALLALAVMGIVLMWRRVFAPRLLKHINQGGKYG
jgi:hypothetical protein